MCFDLDSRPPIGSIAGGALDAERLVLRTGDGPAFGAYLARAADPTGATVVILPDVRGLHPYYEELALRFAEAGVDALAIDYFGRTAGTEVAERGADFDFRAHADRTSYPDLATDVRAAVAYLRADGAGFKASAADLSASGADHARALFTIGFCFGGRLSLLAGTLGLGLAGTIAFYGWPVGPSRAGVPPPAEVAGEIRSPVLAMFGGGDTGIPPEAVAALDRGLAAAGVPREIVSYPGAPHSFFDRKADEWADASADAWARTLAFVRVNTAPSGS